MKLSRMIVLTAISLASTYAHNPSSQSPAPSRIVAGTRPTRQGTAITILNLIYKPETLKQLGDTSELIVEGTVEDRMPAREHGEARSLETDILVTVDRVLKGNPALQRLVLTEPGGTLGSYQELIQNDSPMKAGERYVFSWYPTKDHISLIFPAGLDSASLVSGSEKRESLGTR